MEFGFGLETVDSVEDEDALAVEVKELLGKSGERSRHVGGGREEGMQYAMSDSLSEELTSSGRRLRGIVSRIA